jgi:hypothetical protein
MNSYTLQNIDKLKSSKDETIIFGSGFYGKLAYLALSQKGIEISCFVDENPDQHGKKLYDKNIISLDELKKKSKNVNIFICSGYVFNVIVSRLIKLSFKNIFNCIALFKDKSFKKDNLSFYGVNEYLDQKTINRKIAIYVAGCQREETDKLNIKYVDIMITEACSMKCKDCSNLMQYYSNPKNSELNLLLNSVDKIMTCVDNLFEFRVLGGEPFMNKEIGRIVKHLKKYQSVSQIVIYTNGTIIPSKENLEELKDDKILLDITNYGVLSRNHDRLIETLIREKIPFLTTIPKWTDSGRINFKKKTIKELEFMFKNCCTNDYLTLLNGKLYRCPFSANAMNLNAIPIKNNEYINLENENNNQILKEKIRKLYYDLKYLTACNFCNGRDFTTPRIDAAIQTKEVLKISDYQKQIY